MYSVTLYFMDVPVTTGQIEVLEESLTDAQERITELEGEVLRCPFYETISS